MSVLVELKKAAVARMVPRVNVCRCCLQSAAGFGSGQLPSFKEALVDGCRLPANSKDRELLSALDGHCSCHACLDKPGSRLCVQSESFGVLRPP
jgi:hypothetical protein